MTALIEALTVVAKHLDAHPRLDAVLVSTYALGDADTSVQLTGGPLPAVANALLTWAATLTDTTATAWRPPASDSVHLDLTGTLPAGDPIRIYGAVGYDPTRFLDLEPGGKQSVGLSTLRAWAAEAVAA
ncbi:hypothetical protein V5P93_007090 [Actinokineospora auranticolor]|uniref:Uncharacterized protein n=1 Tax=Actinokineospora auranticolor TaxID=155976 RepID=A0A2S6GGY7_9PSEU|nr:hypothetical protein [Actinokineospora auranticolor]PPK64460.1 hypothetical protein CLV40_11924 [Actinokineospora auranticolor]